MIFATLSQIDVYIRLHSCTMSQFTFFIIVCCLCQTVKTVYPGCDNCGCCVDNECSPSPSYGSGYCTKGCKDSIYGDRCYHQCPSNCAACARNAHYINNARTHDCTKCPEGKYLSFDIKDCSLSCPKTCKTCTSDTICTECVLPYFNYGAITNCSLYCPVNCKRCSESGTCLICQEGHYSPESKCSEACPSNCLSCLSSKSCNKCKNEFYNGRQFDKHDNVYYSDCRHSCRHSCADCSSYNICTTCVQGKYGIYCEKDCSIGCRSTSCNKITGNCDCLHGYKGDQCTQCINGKYGTNCRRECYPACKDKICHKSNGTCVECLSNFFTGEYCTKCINGRYARDCLLQCPNGCKNNKCERSNGDCSDGCKEHFAGNKCNACIPGSYGEQCSSECPKNCKDKTCAKVTGLCSSCNGNFQGEKCEKCRSGYFNRECSELCKSKKCLNNVCHREYGNCTECQKGYYGALCELSCSRGCNGNTCDFETGICSIGCLANFSGDQCCIRSPNCDICETNEDCLHCFSGYYGENCENKCPATCNGACNISSGVCNTCPLEMFGLFCNHSCPVTCGFGSEQRTCNVSTGECLIGCQSGYHGRQCENICSRNCADNKCHRGSGICLTGCVKGFQGNTCDKESTSVSLTGPVGGGVSALIVLVVGGVFGICFLRKRNKKTTERSKENTCETPGPSSSRESTDPTGVTFEEQFLELQEEDNVFVKATEDASQDDTYYNLKTRIKVSDLFSFVENKTRDSFKTEFTRLPKNLIKPCEIAKREENLSKNRYNGMYPYDHSRVQIKGEPTFFINACFIDGFQKKKYYIASLGPTKKTTDEFSTFWKMVWYKKSDAIVMLTNLTETTGMKCEQYWPNLDESIQYGEVNVAGEGVEEYVEFTVRTFTLTKDIQRRTLTQFHYTAWPDKDVPENVTSLIEFRESVKMMPKSSTEGPVIVHCSAGIGRTGTYIALDRLTEEGENNGYVDVYGCVMSMREQRVNMVQTLDQYVFLHKALIHTLTFDCKPIPAEAFIEHVGSMTAKTYDVQFQKIKMSVEDDSEDEHQAIRTNKARADKNRKGADIPGNRYRPRIFLNRSYNDSDYINATNFDSFKNKNHFIMAQTPLSSTVQDFLCLVYQEECSCIVSLEIASDSDKDVGHYLPCESQSLKEGCFTVTCVKSETRQYYILKTLHIRSAGKQRPGEKTVYHYQYKEWKTRDRVPTNAGNFVQFVKDVHASSATTGNSENRSPILVHCLNGAKRSGLFCVVAVLLEKIQMHYQVSVANTIRQIRSRRKSAIPNKEQLEFCHGCVSAHLELYNTYSNFHT